MRDDELLLVRIVVAARPARFCGLEKPLGGVVYEDFRAALVEEKHRRIASSHALYLPVDTTRLSSHGQAATHAEGLASDVLCLVGDKEGDRIGDIFWTSQTSP